MSLPAEQMPSLVERMIRIEAKLDTFNANHQDHEGRIRLLEATATTNQSNIGTLDGRLTQGAQTFADHESRIRGLERRMFVTAGVALLGGGILGVVLGPLLGISGG